ncbi:MAG: ESX secretion-associated protein EspG, partial [Pseudonocardia sp.]|nr:ESX secretion-associated protein EspG [Pseudonocardia sp.]
RLAEFGVPAADASSLARMCTGITAAGQLGATTRLDGARERRGRWVVGFHRARNGDCVQLRRPAGHGTATVTIGPATREKLLAQLTELIQDATALG